MNRWQIPSFLRQDLARKLLALAIAGVVWMIVHRAKLVEEHIADVPIKVRFDERTVYLWETPPKVEVTISGSDAKAKSVTATDIAIEVEVPNQRDNLLTYKVVLGKRHVRLPPGTSLKRIKPNEITLSVDQIQTRDIEVGIEHSGKLKANFQVIGKRSTPAKVRVTGPSRRLRELTTVATQPGSIVLDDKVEDSFEIKDVPLAALGAGITVQPATVQVSYEIARGDDTRTFDNLPIQALAKTPPAMLLKTAPPPISVRLRGPKTALAALRPESILAFVDLGAAKEPGPQRLKVLVLVDSPISFQIEWQDPSAVPVELLPTTPPTPPATTPTPTPTTAPTPTPSPTPDKAPTPPPTQPPAAKPETLPAPQPATPPAAKPNPQPAPPTTPIPPTTPVPEAPPPADRP